MPKRKQHIASDEGEEEAIFQTSEDEQPDQPPKRAVRTKPNVKKKQTIKKPSSFVRAEREDSEDEEDEPPTKRQKPASKGRSAHEGKGAILTDASGDKYIDLGKKKRATVRSFKGAAFVDIREFYEAGGEEKPGKKGIALQAEQWEILKANAHSIDELFAKVGTK